MFEVSESRREKLLITRLVISLPLCVALIYFSLMYFITDKDYFSLITITMCTLMFIQALFQVLLGKSIKTGIINSKRYLISALLLFSTYMLDTNNSISIALLLMVIIIGAYFAIQESSKRRKA